MTLDENLHSEKVNYVEDSAFSKNDWKMINSYTHTETEDKIRIHMYNLAAKNLMKGIWSRDYVQGFLQSQEYRIALLSKSRKQDLTEKK